MVNASAFYMSLVPRISLYANTACCTPNGEKQSWNPDNRGLFVVLHGLKGSPVYAAVTYQEKIHKLHGNKYEVRVPFVPKKGNCSLTEAADPILAIVLDYIEQNPGKPICLIGTSNGARIAAYIETRLRHLNVNIRVTGIAGVFYGSSSMNTIASLNIAQLVLHPSVIADLMVGSDTSKSLIEAMQAPLETGTRTYEFYATVNDAYIPNFSSCFPVVPNAKYNLHSGQDHKSLQVAVRDEELQRAFVWMDSMQPQDGKLVVSAEPTQPAAVEGTEVLSLSTNEDSDIIIPAEIITSTEAVADVIET
jgi:hypothetical protein